MRKAAFHNLGCKVNSYETEAMQQLLEDAGYEIVPFREGADVYIINTCSVTNVADRKSRQMLHRAKKMNPSAAVVAVGCYVQAAGAELKKDEAVDLIVGNNQKKDLVQILDDYFADHENSGEILDIGHSQEYEELHIRRIADHTRAFIKVQDGCNQFCTDISVLLCQQIDQLKLYKVRNLILSLMSLIPWAGISGYGFLFFMPLSSPL